MLSALTIAPSYPTKAPDVYDRLPTLFELDRFESRALETKSETLRELVEEYL